MIFSNPSFFIKSLSLDAPAFFLTNKKGHGLAPSEMVYGFMIYRKYSHPMEKDVHERAYNLRLEIRMVLKRD
jgi:hypothetical protein